MKKGEYTFIFNVSGITGCEPIRRFSRSIFVIIAENIFPLNYPLTTEKHPALVVVNSDIH